MLRRRAFVSASRWRNAMLAQSAVRMMRSTRCLRSYRRNAGSMLLERLGGECERVAPRLVIEHVRGEDQFVGAMAGGEVRDAFAHVGGIANHRTGQRLLHHRFFL